MNIINRSLLRVLLSPTAIYRKWGIHTDQLRAILATKLIMDDRQPNTIRQTAKKKQDKPVKGATIGMIFLSAFLGCIFLTSFAIGRDDVTKLTFYFSMYIFTLASTLISDFTSVLIDVRDTMIILPKPVNDKTFVLARLLHIIAHISKLMFPMTIPGMIAIGTNRGIWPVFPFMLMIIAATLFTIFLINALYLIILRITTPEKFKNIIGYFQIFFAIFFYASYQLVPRMIDKVTFQHFDLTHSTWAWLAPPYWFAGSWQFLTTFDTHTPFVYAFVLSVLLPVISIWIVIRYFAPSFNSKLAMVSGSEGSGTMAVQTGKDKKKKTSSFYLDTITRLFTGSAQERMGFVFTWKMTSRSRDFKMKVYPSLGYIIVYMLILFMNVKKPLSEIGHTGNSKFIFVGIIYFSSFALLLALKQLAFSDKYKAAWIYYVAPVQTPGAIISGSVKAAIAKFYFPVTAGTFLLGIGFCGVGIIPNLLLAVFNLLLIAGVVGYMSVNEFPFGMQQSVKSRSGAFIRGLFLFFLPLLLGGLHFLVYHFIVVVCIGCVLSFIATWMVLDSIKHKTWDQLNSAVFEG